MSARAHADVRVVKAFRIPIHAPVCECVRVCMLVCMLVSALHPALEADQLDHAVVGRSLDADLTTATARILTLSVRTYRHGLYGEVGTGKQ